MSKSRDQVVKEQRIVRLLRSGVSAQRVAELFELTDRRVRQIRASWRDVPSVSVDEIEVDARAVVRTIEQLELLGEEQLVLAESTRHDGIKLGALRDHRETLMQLLQLRVEAGLVPALSAASLENDAVSMVRDLVDVLRTRKVDEETLKEVLAVVERSPLAESEAVVA